jgi:hypothetical protein
VNVHNFGWLIIGQLGIKVYESAALLTRLA